MQMLQLWTLAVLLGAVAGREVCYDRLGCFSDDSPYGGTLERPLKVLPWSPKLVNTRFLLYTNENPNNYQVITADASSIRGSNFKTNRKTHFVIHGFTDKGEDNWLSSICKNMFQVENANCICVDWKGGSRTGYTQATQNVQIVGAEIAYLVKALQSGFGYSPSNVHLIGHSLGSHVAGEAGKRLNGAIGRITGLDPAEPYFQNTPEVVRLDPSDAQFVDAIHTDSAPMIPNMGTRDFVACNHLRSYKYYTDSIVNPTGFAGFSCASYSDFTSDKCFPCPSGGCPQMGHYADRYSRKTSGVGQKFFLNTGDASNFARNEVCYNNLGCFSDTEPWAGTATRPLKLLPWSPEKINTRFLLYTNENPNAFQLLQPSDPSTIEASNFQVARKTRFIIHGFIDKGEESWVLDMCKNMFKVEEVNCICVDWKRGSQTTYTQAANNVRVVGAQLAHMLDVLMTNYSYSPSKVHLIGHSLGAHVAGEAGSRTPGLGRITGLDPVEANFEGTPEEVRLDPSDADFVDVIHTDAAPLIPFLGFGTNQMMGHIDFFPNGGQNMPGCKKNALSQIVDLDGIWSGTRDFVACNHLRSYKYYLESILNPDGFAAYPCTSYKDFESDKCFPCPVQGCPQMGHYADQFAGRTSEQPQKFFLNTGDAKNFARWRYRVSLTLSGRTVTGQVKVALFGSKGNTQQYDIFRGIMKPGATHASEFDAKLDVGTIEKVKFLWNNHVVNPSFPKVGAAKITVQKGEEQTKKEGSGNGEDRMA
ncbi:Pancreatic lipase-related protein 1 [Cricetulus griseus]|uniref:Triacylglycerol lipase n=1 Tax=Cricetulus griseus TaxID=10029 RepID=G3IL04_CRIGR|nr:Pancreatic lipase-related protein 1 [Cricetulus griseus]